MLGRLSRLVLENDGPVRPDFIAIGAKNRMLKIRLRRMGAIRQPHYRIVVADSRSPRDGRFLESIGHYNPLTDPATIQIDVTKYESWKSKGAQPTNAVASLVKQYGRMERKAAAAGEEAQPTSRKTRTASGRGVAPATATQEAATDEATQEVDLPMNEAVAEATRDEGEGSEAIVSGGDMAEEGGVGSDEEIGEAAETGGNANPGAADENA
jgi:small subunit ribosomal protein S16